MAAETHTCIECGAEVDIIHNEKSPIQHCPFCGEDIMSEEDLEEWKDEMMWEEDEE